MVREAEVPVGWRAQGGAPQQIRLPLSTVLRHQLITGTTGWGKSGYIIGLTLYLLTKLRDIGVIIIDAKGETASELIDNFLPALFEQHPRLAPDNIITIRPFGQYGVRLNPLAPVPSLSAEVQAHLVCQLLARLADDAFGPRMLSILSSLCQATMAGGGTLLDVLELLRDPDYAWSFAQRVADPAQRQYLLTTFAQEPASSRDALRARLEWLLLLPGVRAMLCARGCLPGAELLEAPLAIIDLGDAPQGCLPIAYFFGELLLSRLTGAIFSRQLPARPVLLAVDEWQEFVRFSGAAEVERLLSQARYRKASLLLANQTLAQVSDVSPALVRSLLANISLHLAFRPEAADVKHLLHLLPTTGRIIDPAQPDRLLSVEAERRMLLDRLGRLPPRHALLGDLVAGRAEIVRTLDVPYALARSRAAQLDQQARERFRRGRHGVLQEVLLKEVARPGVLGLAQAARAATTTSVTSAADAPAHTSAKRRRPPLVLP